MANLQRIVITRGKTWRPHKRQATKVQNEDTRIRCGRFASKNRHPRGE